MKKGLFEFNVRDIVEIAIFCALAIVLDTFVKIPLGATGGSINISMLPIFIISLRHGWFKGLFAGGFVYGLITCLLDNYGPASYPLDYLVGFVSVAIIGVFAPYIARNFSKSSKHTVICFALVILSVAIWSTTRFFASSINSVIIWEYTWDAAFIYNLTYVYFSAIADAILLCLLLYVIHRLSKVYPTTFLKEVRKNKLELTNNE